MNRIAPLCLLAVLLAGCERPSPRRVTYRIPITATTRPNPYYRPPEATPQSKPAQKPFTADDARALVKQAAADAGGEDVLFLLQFAISSIEHEARNGKIAVVFSMLQDKPDEFRARFRKALETRGFQVIPAHQEMYGRGAIIIRWAEQVERKAKP